MKKYYYVYKITNLVNAKIYVGKHSTDKLDDNYMGSGVVLHQAYQKYGLECFSKEVIQFYNNDVELNQGEIYWIAQFNSTDPNIGYNRTFGGDGGVLTTEVRQKISTTMKGLHRSEETKRKICEAKKGKPRSEETKRKIGEAMKGKNNPMYGKPLSEEHKRKISETRKLYWQKRNLDK